MLKIGEVMSGTLNNSRITLKKKQEYVLSNTSISEAFLYSCCKDNCKEKFVGTQVNLN